MIIMLVREPFPVEHGFAQTAPTVRHETPLAVIDWTMTAPAGAVTTDAGRGSEVTQMMSPPSNAALPSEALFASDLQPSQDPGAGEIRAAIVDTLHKLGPQGCAACVAQEFGDHPDTAMIRMQWVREAVLHGFRPADHEPVAGPRIAFASAA
jgi:hypothetical protein